MGERTASLRSSRKNTRNRVRVFENRSPYGPVMAQRSLQKIRAKNRFRNLNLDLKLEPAGPGGKIPALSMSTGLSTGLSTGVSTCLSTCLSTGVRCPVKLGAPVWVLGLAWRAGSGSFFDLTGLNQSRVNLRV